MAIYRLRKSFYKTEVLFLRMAESIALSTADLIRINRDLPVHNLAEIAGIPEESVATLLRMYGYEPIYASERLAPSSKMNRTHITIPQAMEKNRLSYEQLNDAILAGELAAIRPETNSDSYWLSPRDVQKVADRIKNGGIKPRRDLRSEMARKERKLFFPEDGPSHEKRFLTYLCQVPLLTREEEQALLKQVREGDEVAIDDLIEANVRLVYGKVLANYKNCPSLEPMDLFQEGIFGLQRAAFNYSPEKRHPETGAPLKFSTYATWWINQTIMRAIVNQAFTIRIPVHVYERQHAIAKWVLKFIDESGVEPSIEQIISGLPQYKLSQIKSDIKYMTWTPSGPDFNFHEEPMHLDDLLKEGEHDTFHEIIADTKLPSPAAAAIDAEERQRLETLLGNLRFTHKRQVSERDKAVFSMRYGLQDGISHTLQEVGDEFGVTRERIRQIETTISRLISAKANYRPLDIQYRLHMKNELSHILEANQNTQPYLEMFFHKYGYVDGKQHTYAELAASYNVPRSSINKGTLRVQASLKENGIMFDGRIHFTEQQLEQALNGVRALQQHKDWYKLHFGLNEHKIRHSYKDIAVGYHVYSNLVEGAIDNLRWKVQQHIMEDALRERRGA